MVQQPHVFKLRRATDRYMAVGFVAVAVFMWVLVVRVALRAEWASAGLYLLPTLLMTYAAAGMTRLMLKHWERGPAPEPAAHTVPVQRGRIGAATDLPADPF